MMTSEEVTQIATTWKSLSNGQRSRLLQGMTKAQKQLLRQSIRATKRSVTASRNPA